MMTFVEGFVLAVPAGNKEIYLKHAADAEPLFKEFGVARMVETWADDVTDGNVTDFKRAVKAKDDETVVFSWFEYPDRETRDAANAKMTADPRMEEMGASMPFDGKRMIMGGFAAILDEGARSAMGYADGFVVPVPSANREAYREVAAKAAAGFLKHGATRVVEAWEEDVPDGKVTDFRGAVQFGEGESVVFSWIEWPSKESRVEGWKKIMEDPTLQPGEAGMPFDGKRLIYGGFAPILDA
jgi:uncharacterized protein YbaA (DUF1428 family)